MCISRVTLRPFLLVSLSFMLFQFFAKTGIFLKKWQKLIYSYKIIFIKKSLNACILALLLKSIRKNEAFSLDKTGSVLYHQLNIIVHTGLTHPDSYSFLRTDSKPSYPNSFFYSFVNSK